MHVAPIAVEVLPSCPDLSTCPDPGLYKGLRTSIRNVKKEFLVPLLSWRLSRAIDQSTTVANIRIQLFNLVSFTSLFDHFKSIFKAAFN